MKCRIYGLSLQPLTTLGLVPADAQPLAASLHARLASAPVRLVITSIEIFHSSKNILGIRVATFDDTPPLSGSSGGNQNECQTD